MTPPPGARRLRGRVRGDEGQAAVELALVLPVLALLALVLVQLALVARDQLRVTFGAREGARQAAVSPGTSEIEEAVRVSTGLDDERLAVLPAGRGGVGSRVTVRVRYRSPTQVPLVGPLLGDVEVEGVATMRVEG